MAGEVTHRTTEHPCSLAVAKNRSTSFYGTIVALDESPLLENLLYVGTDDGFVQVSEDGSGWRKQERFPGVPERSYVADVHASPHDANVVYAAFNNRTDEVLGKTAERHTSAEFVAFLTDIVINQPH